MSASAGASLVQELAAAAEVAAIAEGRVFQNKVPEHIATLDNPPAYIWLQVDSVEHRECLSPPTDEIIAEGFAVECTSMDVTEAIALGRAVRSFLGLVPPGPFGNGQCNGFDVFDQNDEYVARNRQANQGASVAALDVICHLYKEP